MEFPPRFHQSLLLAWQRTRDQLHRLDAEDRLLILIVCMKMRNMMLSACLDEHPYNDPEEPTELRHFTKTEA